MIAIVHSIYSQSVHALALNAGSMDNDAGRYCVICRFKVNHIHRNVQKFYCKVNSVLFDFKDMPSGVKSKLIDTYYLDLYGSLLWQYRQNDVNAFYIAYRKVIKNSVYYSL